MVEQPALGDARAMLHHVRLADLPEPLRSQLAVFDTNGDGTINPDELPTGASDYISIKAFPADLQKLLNEIDDEKNGKLELDELLEIFTMYAEMKKANREGSISIKTLPKEIQYTLRAFDVDGDGTVAPMELARGAQLYKESKQTTKRLMIFSGVLLIVMCALVAVIVSLTAVVVEETKETKADNSGALVKKGTSTPVGTAKATKSLALFDMPGQSAGVLSGVKRIDLQQLGTLLGYTITGYRATDTKVTFLASSGDVVAVDNNFINVTSASGMPVYSEQKSAKRRRGLLAADDSKVTVESSTTGNTATATASGVCFNLYHRYEETSGGLNPDSINPSDKANAEKECVDKCASMKDQGCVGFTMAGDKSVCYLKSAYDTTKPYVFAGEGSWTDYYFEGSKAKNGYDACKDKNEAEERANAQGYLDALNYYMATAKNEAEDKANPFANPLASKEKLVVASKTELVKRISIWKLDQGAAIRAFGEMNDWDISSVTDLSGLFDFEPVSSGCMDPSAGDNDSLGRPNIPDISRWDVSKVTDMSNMFRRAQFDGGNWNLNEWDVSKVTNMRDMFMNAEAFNQDISGWNTAKVTNMMDMFYGAKAFNKEIGKWDTSQVTNMRGMFQDAKAFDKDIGEWDVSKVTNMRGMFSGAEAFNKDIGKWDTSQVTNMWGMFTGAKAFNQDISGWKTAGVTIMNDMFNGAKAFDQDIGTWDTSKVAETRFMFRGAEAFNQDISGWKTAEVVTMQGMFMNAKAFNKDISKWDTSKVNNLNQMFEGAASNKCSVQLPKKITCS
ncbi:EF-hand domain-containing protein [Pycnococcus provasolii]